MITARSAWDWLQTANPDLARYLSPQMRQILQRTMSPEGQPTHFQESILATAKSDVSMAAEFGAAEEAAMMEGQYGFGQPLAPIQYATAPMELPQQPAGSLAAQRQQLRAENAAIQERYQRLRAGGVAAQQTAVPGAPTVESVAGMMAGTPRPGYEQLLVDMMRYGVPREQTHQVLQRAVQGGQLPSGASVAHERQFLESQYLRGYGQVLKKFPHVSPAALQHMPEHQLLKMKGAIPLEQLPQDPYGRPIIPETHFVRKPGQEKHAWPISAVTEGSLLPAGPGGGVYTTWQEDPTGVKALKRTAMLHTHEQVHLAGLQQATGRWPVTGPGHTRPEPAQEMRGIYTVGGGLGGPGAVMVSPTVGPYATQTAYREISPEIAKAATWIARPGAEFAPGQPVQLAGGMDPLRAGKWGHRITDVAALPGGGYGVTMERFARVREAQIRFAAGGGKGMGMFRPIEQQFFTPEGAALQPQFVQELKDPMGAAYEWYRHAGAAALRQDIMRYRELEGTTGPAIPEDWWKTGTWRQVGYEAHQAWERLRMPELLQEVHYRRPMTQQILERYQETGAWVRGTPVTQMGGGIVEATTRAWGLVGDWARQASHIHGVRQPRLSYEELQNVRRTNPEMYQYLMETSQESRGSYLEVLNAMMASAPTAEGRQRYAAPSGTMAAGDVPLTSFFQQAQEAVGPRGTHRQYVRAFQQALAGSEFGGAPISVPTPQGRMVIPSARVLERFRAGGGLEDEEMSGLIGAATRLLGGAASQLGPEGMGRLGSKYLEQIIGQTTGEAVLRGVGAAPIPGGVGMPIRMSEALHTGEMAVPGRTEGMGYLVGFPSPGSGVYRPELAETLISAEEKARRGIPGQELTASIGTIQRYARDTDGDLGEWVPLPDGSAVLQKVLDAQGNPIKINEAQVSEYNRRLEEGAGYLWGEMAGGTPESARMDREAAEALIRGRGRELTEAQMGAQFRAGAEMYGRIGSAHTPYRGAQALQMSPEATGVMETLFNLEYGHAQRPAMLPEQMERFRDIRNFGIWSDITGRQSSQAYSTRAGGPVTIAGGMVGPTAAMSGMLDVFLNLEKQRGGGPMLSAQDIGLLMGTGQTRAGITQAVEAYRALPAGADVSRARGEIMEALGGAGQVLRSPVGGMVFPAQIARALKKGAQRSQLGPFTPEDIDLAIRIRAEQQAQITAMRRQTSPTLEHFMERVEAYRAAVPGAGIVERERISEEAGMEQDIQAIVQASGLPEAQVRAQVMGVSQLSPLAGLRQAMASPLAPLRASTGRGAATGTVAGTMRGVRENVAAWGAMQQAPEETEYVREMMRAMSAAGPPTQPPPPTMTGAPAAAGPTGGGGDEGWDPSRYTANLMSRTISGVMGISESKFRSNLNLLRDNLERWNETMGDAPITTENLTKQTVALTKTMAKYQTVVERGFRQEIPPPAGARDAAAGARFQGLQEEARMVMEGRLGPTYGRLWQARQQLEQYGLEQQFAAAEGGMPPGDGFGGGMGGRIMRFWGRFGGITGPAQPGMGGFPQGPMGAAARGLERMFSGWELMRLRRIWQILGAPVFQQQIPAAAQAQMAGWQAAGAIGGMPLGAFPGGIAGGLMQYQAAQQQGLIEAGQLGYQAYGAGLPAQIGAAGRGLQAIVGPAMGWGMQAGGIATTLASTLGGMGFGAAATGVGLPVAALTTLAIAATTIPNLLEAQAAPTAENQLELAFRGRPRGGLGGAWQAFRRDPLRAIGQADIAGNIWDLIQGRPRTGPSGALAQDIRDYEAGMGIRTTALGALQPDIRTAALNALAGQLRGQGGVWGAMDTGQIAQLVGQAAAFAPEVGGMSIDQILAQPPELLQAMATTGMTPQQYQPLAQQLRLGPYGGAQILGQMVGMPAWQQRQAEYLMGQYAPIAQVQGREAGRMILEQGTVGPRAAEARELGGALRTVAGLPFGPGVQRLFGGAAAGVEARAAEMPPELERLTSRQQAQLEEILGLQTQAGRFGMQFPVPEEGYGPEYIESRWGGAAMLRRQLGAAQQIEALGAPPELAFRGAVRAGMVGGPLGIMGLQGLLGGDRFTMSLLGQANLQGPFTQVGLPGGMQMDVQPMKEAIVAGLKEFVPAEYFDNMMEMIDNLRPLMEPETGLPMGTTRMYGGFAAGYALPGTVDPARFQQFVEIAEQGGRRALELRQTEISQGYRDFQTQQAEQQLRLREVSQFGGRFTSPYSGGTLDTRGTFAIQRELRNLSRIWEDFTDEYSRQNRALAYRQFMENWQVQAARMPVQFQWQREDLAFRGQQQAIQFGWQMEDIQEGLRFATGRERRRLLRQQERGAISFGMGQGRLATLGERVDIRERWAEEDLERQRRHYEERYALSDEYQQRYRQHVAERRKLEDELQRIREFNARFAIDADRAQLERQKEMEAQLRAIQEVLKAMNQELENAAAQEANIVQMITWLMGQLGQYGPIKGAWNNLITSMIIGIDQVAARARSVLDDPYIID